VRAPSCRTGGKAFVKATVPLNPGSALVPLAYYLGATAPEHLFVVFEAESDPGTAYTQGKNHLTLFAVVDRTPGDAEHKAITDRCKRTCTALVRCQLESDLTDCTNTCANDESATTLYECLCRAKGCADMPACTSN
jgi:hypothetical protein